MGGSGGSIGGRGSCRPKGNPRPKSVHGKAAYAAALPCYGKEPERWPTQPAYLAWAFCETDLTFRSSLGGGSPPVILRQVSIFRMSPLSPPIISPCPHYLPAMSPVHLSRKRPDEDAYACQWGGGPADDLRCDDLAVAQHTIRPQEVCYEDTIGWRCRRAQLLPGVDGKLHQTRRKALAPDDHHLRFDCQRRSLNRAGIAIDHREDWLRGLARTEH